jgi:polysaccharide biosynthesis/export protein
MKDIKNLSFKPVLIILFSILTLFAQFCSIPAMAQDQPKQEKLSDDSYIIGVTDRLSISFWQQPDLNRDIRVSETGMISLPVIGEIKAVGLTTAELSKKIIQQMSIYNTPVSQATVVVTEFNSRSVVVSGQVLNSGTYRYEKIPDIWKVILDAGGPTGEADLSRVSIIRKEGEKSNVINVDLYSIIRSGDLTKAPQLQAGDLVNIPISTYGTNMSLGGEQKFEGRNIVFIFGQVTEQGPRNLDEGMDVLDAIAVAHGFTLEADLKNVRVIMKDKKYSTIVKLDLDRYIKTGSPPRMMLHPEDTIIVPARRSGLWDRTIAAIGGIAPILGAIGTAVILIRQ